MELNKLAEKSLSNGVVEIIDLLLLEEICKMDTNISFAFKTTSNNAKQHPISIVKIGVTCLVNLSGQRISMSEVSSNLCFTQNKLLRSKHG